MSPGRFERWEDAVHWLRNQPEKRDLVYASYYDDPLPSAADRYWRGEEWAAVRRWLPAYRGSALDVGAGRGIASYALAQDGFCRVVALEPDPSSLVGAGAIRTLATAERLPIEVVEEYSEALPFADHSFDLVFARAALHHMRDLEAACREFSRVLKPGGKLLAIREHVISRRADLSVFLERHPLHRLYGGENAYLLDDYERAIIASGLRLQCVIAPFDSAMNYAPHTEARLRAEIAARVGRSSAMTKGAIERLLAMTWSIVRPVLNAVDSRPGRLYSFVATRDETLRKGQS